MTEFWAIALILIASFLGSFGALRFKIGANNLHRDIRLLATNYDLMKGILIYGVSTVFYVVGIKGGELSVLFPLVSTGYIWTCMLSIKYLGEKMNRTKWVGIALILFGVSLIGIGH